MSKGLGRLYSEDYRDHHYLIARRLAAPGTPMPTQKTWRISSNAWDQGNTGTCVGAAWYNFLRCAPIQTSSKQMPNPFNIYRAAVKLDEWSDNDHEAEPNAELQFGTSVRAGAEAVTATGRLKSYLWAFSLQPALEFVLTQGPVVLGTDWAESFMRPDKEGIVRLGNNPTYIGGHAYLWRGADTKRGLARCSNSWSDEWGLSGEFFIPLRDLEQLIHQNGEACSAIEQRVKSKL